MFITLFQLFDATTSEGFLWANIGEGFGVWVAVDDSQTPTWTSVDDSQTVVWSEISDISTTWTPVDDSQSTTWTEI